MLVLHGNWIRGRFFLWGETVPDVRVSALQGTAASGAFRSPYDAGRLNLGATVAVLAHSKYRARARHARRVTAELPTADGRPLPSRMCLLPLEWAEPKGAVTMAKWLITALPLSTFELASLFAACEEADDPYASIAPKISAGRDLIAFAKLWRFAGAVVARQCVAPAIVGTRSRWLPVLNGADEQRLADFAHELPVGASCIEGAIPSPDCAFRFFEDAVDLIVRSSVSTVLTRLHAAKGHFCEVHSAWLASLRSPNAEIKWPKREEIDEFAAVLAAWRSPVATAKSGGMSRFGLRVSDPRNPGAPNPMWRLTPVVVRDDKLQNLSNRSLADVPPADRENILIALGQASMLCPILANDDVGNGEFVPLDASEVNLFLTETAPVLRAAGFSVFTPSWWTPSRRGGGSSGDRDNTRLRLRASDARFASQGTGFFSLDALVDVKWQIVLGDAELTKDDVEKILSSGKPLVRWKSRWLYADRARLTGALEKLRELESGPVSVRTLVQMSAGSSLFSEGNIELDLSRIEKRGDFGQLVGRLRKDTKLEEVDPPPGFVGTLRPYQRRGLSWLAFLAKWGFGACLADDMGLGKTIEAIALFLHLRAQGERRPVLVVCPMSIMTKWQREFAKFAPGLRTWIFHGPDRPTGEAFDAAVAETDVVITSYHLLCMDFASISRVTWSVAALDEAQNIKNPDTRKSRLARTLSAGWRLALTGTPVENSVGDLWAIMDFLNRGLLSTRSRFAEAFLRPIQMGTDPAARETLRKITGPFILRRLKTDPEIVADMPPRIEEKVYCTLSAEQAELYSAEIKDLSRLLSSASGAARRGNVLGLLTRLKQICNHPEHYFSKEAEGGLPEKVAADRSGKLRRFDEILDDVLAAGECALVFTQYAVMGKLLQRHLRARLGYEVPFLHGGVNLRGRDEMVARFQRPDGPPVFILSIKAGGTGLDLTRANHVFHFDRWWNPAVENQAADRAHRIGQKKSVFIHTMICDGTLESRIDDLITGKTELAREIIGSGDKWLTGLSDERIRDIVALSSSAYEETDGGTE